MIPSSSSSSRVVELTSRDGLLLKGREWGTRSADAPLVLMLHGLTRNSRDFEDFGPWLAQLGWWAVALDMRGRGMSDRDANFQNYMIATYVADVEEWMIKVFHRQSAVFIGTSMGGIITMSMDPERVQRAVLNDIGPDVAAAGLKRIASYAGGSGNRVFKTEDDMVDYAKYINAFALPNLKDWPRFARRIFNDRMELDYDSNISKAFDKSVADLWPRFQKLANARPCLVLRGETSDILEAQTVDKMVAVKPEHVQAVTIPGVGHAPLLDEPESLEAIRKFISTK